MMPEAPEGRGSEKWDSGTENWETESWTVEMEGCFEVVLIVGVGG